MLRCPLCAGLRHSALARSLLRCHLCGLAFRPDAKLPAIACYQAGRPYYRFPNWNNWLSRGSAFRLGIPHRDVCFAANTVCMLAYREASQARRAGLAARGAWAATAWRLGRTLRTELLPVARTAPSDSRATLSLGILATPHDRADVLELAAAMAGSVAEIIVVLDTAEASAAVELKTAAELCQASQAASSPVRVIAHPLAANFAAQRNILQEAARTPWVLHLDTDERLSSHGRRMLAPLMQDADYWGWNVVSLPRQNVVDGVVSALYPDVQYRLLRSSTRFERAVHEFPSMGGHPSAPVCPGADIIHSLRGERLERREREYEAIQAGAGRPHDTALLRTPLDIELPRFE